MAMSQNNDINVYTKTVIKTTSQWDKKNNHYLQNYQAAKPN